MGRSRGRLAAALSTGRLVAAVGALALCVVLAGCVSSAHPSAHPSGQASGNPAQNGSAGRTTDRPMHTVDRQFRAFDASGNPVVSVERTVAGNCWTTSIAVSVSGAYRCFAANDILDPCFARTGRTPPAALYCVADPWSDAVVLRLTAPLPSSSPAGRGHDGSARPWALELANGARCVASTGTVPAVAGVDLDYHCSNGADAALDASAGAGPGADWRTASYAATPAVARTQTVPVAVVWRAA